MESRLFYDIRGAEVPSGVFDLRTLKPPVRASLHRVIRQQAPALGLPETHLTEAGYVVVREPPNGPNTRWGQSVFSLQRNVEVTLGRRVQMLAKVERVYVMKFPAFTPGHWEQLAKLFSELPEWRSTKPFPHWFGPKNEPPPYVWAQITHSGLHVRGLLSPARWAGWDTWLRKNLYLFPLISEEDGF